jgi:GAF domain-containing protein
MTGRGLTLVDALAARWGAERSSSGKVVWAELTEASATELDPGEVDVDALLRGWPELEPDAGAAPRYTITLGDVPTDLLLAAKAHVDSLARELSLTAVGAASGMTAQMPAHVAELVNAVVSEFAEARQSIKRQALAAAARGDERTTLTLTLPASAADAGERYLAGLDMADAHAGAARLLTLEASPQHRAFRHWYVRSLVTALRHVAKGMEPPRTPTFEEFLLGEIGHLAELQRVSQRGARLQRVTAALAGVMTADEVTTTVLDEAITALLAARGVVVRPGDDGAFDVVAQAGYDEDHVAWLLAEAAAGRHPIADAYRSGEPVWMESREDRTYRDPSHHDPDAATCAVPLTSGYRALGAVWLGFAEPRLFDEEEQSFLVALAAAAAQALERAQLYEHQRTLADRLSRLQEVTAAFARTRDIADVGGVVIDNALHALEADLGTLSLLDDDGDTLRVVASRSVHPAMMSRFETFSARAQLPASEAVRTGRIVMARNRAERDARWPALAGLPPAYEHALVCLPLRVESRSLGALSVSFADLRRISDAEMRWLSALADACAQALLRARSVERLELANAALAAANRDLAHANERLADANDKLTFLAAASSRLASSLDYEKTVAEVARLAVPRLADWVVVHVLDDGHIRNLTVAHVDPAKVAMAEEAQARWPESSDDDAGVARVIRTGVSEVYPDITDDMLALGARDAEHLRLLREVGMSSVLVVPLKAADRTIGALTLIAAESGRRYSDEDLPFAEDVASRAAHAIANARRYARLVAGDLPEQADAPPRRPGAPHEGLGGDQRPSTDTSTLA